MVNHPVAVSAIVLSILAGSDAAAAERGALFVADHALAFHATTDSDVPPHERLDARVPPRAPLFLWTRIAGTEEALQRLRGARRIPVQHRWSANCGGIDGSAESVAQESEQPFPVGAARESNAEKWDRLMADLGTEIDINRARGQPAIFDWRTRSRRDTVLECRYRVRVTDENNRPLYCEKLGGDCLIEFTVRR